MLRLTEKALRYIPTSSTNLAKRSKRIIEQQRLLAFKTARAAGGLSTGFAMPRPTRGAV